MNELFLINYILIGLICSVWFELLMRHTGMSHSTTIFERITWIVLWPVYTLIFIISILK